jgi:hypothetical protein
LIYLMSGSSKILASSGYCWRVTEKNLSFNLDLAFF